MDCLVVDEAHRLTEKSGYHSNLGENQVKEIINASKFSIFFLDENQRVTLKVADEIIKNTYRTLMTRGMKGCYVYCTDKNLSDYLRKRLNQRNEIIYSTDNEEITNNMMIAEDSEEYRYE